MRRELEFLLNYAFTEWGDLERSTSYKEVVAKVPEVAEIWKRYKATIEEAEIVFKHRFEKLIEADDE